MNEKLFLKIIGESWLELDKLQKALKDNFILKDKVKEVIDNFEPSKWNQMDRFDDWFRKELKKELGLK